MSALDRGADRETGTASPRTTCSRILITIEITDPEIVADYKDTCDELVWEDLVNGNLIKFAEFVSRENAAGHSTGG